MEITLPKFKKKKEFITEKHNQSWILIGKRASRAEFLSKKGIKAPLKQRIRTENNPD